MRCTTSCDEVTLWDKLIDYLKEQTPEKGIRDLGEFVQKLDVQEESWKHFAAKVDRINWKKKQNACLLNMVEITSSKKAQTEMISKHYRNILLTTASHELMTPLNGILGGVQLIESCDSMEKVHRYCEILTCSCKFLINITQDMHDYCLYESGSLVLTKEMFNLRDLMNEAFGMVEIQAHQRGVVASLVYDDAIPEPIYSDRKRLMQVFLNLLSNATKYTFKGAITFTAKYKDPLITIEIADTGIGISEEKQKSLFKLFAAAESQSPASPRIYAGAGSGLGLTVSQALTRMLGTGISFSTRENVGSTFSFSLFKELPRKRSASVRNLLYSPLKAVCQSTFAAEPMCLPTMRKSRSRIGPTKDSSTNSPSGFMMRRNKTEAFDLAGGRGKSRKSSISSGQFSLGEDERGGASPARSLSTYKLVLKNSFSLDIPSAPTATCDCPDVLIVDDNAFNLLVLQSLIEKLGLRCETVRDHHV